MKLDKLVINASPIISLAKIDCAGFLLKISSKLVIPEGVAQEILCCTHQDAAVKWISAKHLQELILPVEVPAIISEWNLGKGESQVIAFALQHRNCTAGIDDRAAKKCAEVFDIKVSGTISFLIKAKMMGLTPKVAPLFSALRTNGFRVSEEILKAALQIVNED